MLSDTALIFLPASDWAENPACCDRSVSYFRAISEGELAIVYRFGIKDLKVPSMGPKTRASREAPISLHPKELGLALWF